MEQEQKQNERYKALLADAREKIATADAAMHELIKDRCAAYEDVWQAKKALNRPVRDPAKEISKLLAARGQEPNDSVGISHRAALAALMRVSRMDQYRRMHAEMTNQDWALGKLISHAPTTMPEFKVAVNQGTKASYSAQAAAHLFPQARLLQIATFMGAAQQVKDEIAPVAVLPLENTTAGTVDEVYGLLEHMGLYIIASIDVPISHNICVLPGAKLADIRQVTSHPQALAQCSMFIKTMGWTERPVRNTAFAARDVAEIGDKSLAALASADAAEASGLDILPVRVANNAVNTTRFVALAKQPIIVSDANTLSVLVHLSHKSGALADFLSFLADYDINLKKIQSRPVPERPWEYSILILKVPAIILTLWKFYLPWIMN